MDYLNRRQIEQVMSVDTPGCVSIYLPTHRSGDQIQQDPIRLKNQIAQAERELEQQSPEGVRAKDVLAPARELLEQVEFWQHQSDGLALFLAPGRAAEIYRLPVSFEEFTVVDNQFHIKPLLPAIQFNGRFYILALSQNKVRVFSGTQHAIEQLEPSGVPDSLKELLVEFDAERHLQYFSYGAGGNAEPANQDGAVMYHGQGGPERHHKDRLVEYFRRIDAGLHDLLQQDPQPLVFAGVDYLLPLYRQANTYAHLIDDGISGNPDEASPQQLHAAAWKILEPRFRQAQETAAEQFRQSRSKGLASDRLGEVLPAAREGRVETLFVAHDEHEWGQFDDAQGAVTTHEERQSDSQDLLDVAVKEALAHGGRVYVLPENDLPGTSRLAAVYRYATTSVSA